MGIKRYSYACGDGYGTSFGPDRAGDARTEAQTSIRLAPNATAYLVLARLDMSTNNLASAASNVGNALRLEPRNAAAQAMKLALQQRDQSLP